MMSARRKATVALLAVAVVGGPAGFAIAQTDADGEEVTASDCPEAARTFNEAGWNAEAEIGGPTCPGAGEVEAVVELCPPVGCHIVNIDADKEQAPSSEGEKLDAAGRPANACPEAAAVFESAGNPVDAFIGRCPTAAEATDLATPSPAQEKLNEMIEESRR